MIEILKIVGAHGIKGAVRVALYSEHIDSYQKLYEKSGVVRKFRVVKRGKDPKYCIVALEGIADRNAAESLVGNSLFIRKEDLPNLEENEFFVHDLVGKDISIECSDEKCKIISVQNFGASDLIEISYRNEDSFYVPFTKENFPTTTNGEILISSDAIRMYK